MEMPPAGPDLAACPSPLLLPLPQAAVDWSFAQACDSPRTCRPVAFTDCQQTTTLPAGAPYTKDCQRAPLENDTKHFPDCNSIHTDASHTLSCFNVTRGEILDSGRCAAGWVDATYAATHCCGPASAADPHGRAGKGIPPAPADCAAYRSDEAYQHKCPKSGGAYYSHPLD